MTDLRLTAALAGSAATSMATSSPRAVLATDDNRTARWAVHTDSLDLYTDRGEDDRVLLLNCGGAVHRAVIALAADGFACRVVLLPDGDEGGRIAALTPTEPIGITDEARELALASERRPSLRPSAVRTPPAPDAVAVLIKAAVAEGVAVHLLDQPQVAELAGTTSMSQKVRERVGRDTSAAYAVLHGGSTAPEAWVRAGMALSALSLEAVRHGLTVSPSSSVVELRGARAVLRRVLPTGSTAYVAVRIEPAAP